LGPRSTLDNAIARMEMTTIGTAMYDIEDQLEAEIAQLKRERNAVRGPRVGSGQDRRRH